jgi:hypothetical protein
MMLAKVVVALSITTAIVGWMMWRIWSVERAETDLRHRRRILLALGLTYLVSALIGVAATLRAPKNQSVLVAYIQGDGFSRSATAKDWKYGESIECVLASGSHQFPPDNRGDVLLCGDWAQHVWSMVWLRSDVKDQVYAAARMFDVTFHSTGRGSRNWGNSWSCKMLHESIDCE